MSNTKLGAMKRYVPVLFALMIGNALPALAGETAHSYKPASGYVPDAETAIRIAVAIWEPIYGRERIEAERPYRASLRNGVWVVEGTLLPGTLGGVAVAEISKADATVLRVSHGK